MRGSVTAAGAVVKGMKHPGGNNCIANALAIPNISLCSQLYTFPEWYCGDG